MTSLLQTSELSTEKLPFQQGRNAKLENRQGEMKFCLRARSRVRASGTCRHLVDTLSCGNFPPTLLSARVLVVLMLFLFGSWLSALSNRERKVLLKRMKV